MLRSYSGNIFLLLYFLLLGLSPLFGQAKYSYSFVNYSNKDRFNQNTVNSIEQDKYGILWLGTSNGLIRYDGNTFQNISWESEDQSNIYNGPILNILSDSKGQLWIVSRGGLNIYFPDKERFFKITSDSLEVLNKTIEDSDGSMWVIGNKFLSKTTCKITNDTVIVKWSPNLLVDEYAELNILDLLKISENQYLLATATGLYKMSLENGVNKAIFEAEELAKLTTVNCLALHKNMIWIGSTAGLYKTVLDGSKLRLLNIYMHDESDMNSLANDNIKDLMIGKDDNLWIGTWLGGLSLYNENNEDFTNFTYDSKKKGGISSNMINCIYEDPFNVIWIGTAQAGLNKLDLNKKQFANIEHNPYDDNTIPSNLINCILEDRNGYLWVGTYNHALCRSTTPINDSNIENLTFRRFDNWFNTFPNKIILSIYEDKKGYIWLGYEDGVAVYNSTTNTFSKINFVSDDQKITIQFVRNIKSIDNESILLAGSSIIVLKDPWKIINSQQQVIIPVHTIYTFKDQHDIAAIKIDNPKKFWVGYQNTGLSLFGYDKDSLFQMNHFEYIENDQTSISSNAVFCFYEDPNQSLWIGTFGGGLNRLENIPGSQNNSFERLRDTIDLVNNAFYGIIEENDSIIWCATDMGIFKLNTKSYESHSYNMYDGLLSNNFRMNAYHKGRSGFYYFGGLNGLSAFKPDQIKPNLIPPIVRITELKINNKKVPVGERRDNRVILKKHISEESKMVLRREDKTISLGLTVYHTSIPEKNRLSYILEGFDKEWIEVKQGFYSATYTNLKPGDYTFRARGYNCDGLISENEASIHIKVLAPWFARLFSKVLFALLSISIISAIFIYLMELKNLQNKLHFEKLDKERIKEVNLSKLRFFTNISHEFKTPLSLISIPLQKLKEISHSDEEKGYVEMIEKNSNRLIRLIDQLLTFRRIEHGGLSLKVSETSMEDFIYPVADAFESLSLKKEILFYYQVKDPAFLIHMDLEKMEQVLFNLLSNAFKFTPAKGKVRLEGYISEIENKKYACFDVTDNGIGIPAIDMDKIFDRFYQSASELQNMGTGIGLSYSKSIVELHKGTIKAKSIPGKSTCISVMIPADELQSPDTVKNVVKRIDAHELLEYEKISSNSATYVDSEDKQKPCILIADDEVDFRNIIISVLKKNYRILEASNGIEAMEIATSGEADVIISDVMMPGMNGYDFCKKIKTDIQYCHIPFILLTALEELDSHIQGVEHGADSYISKPFNLKYLEVTVRKLIENREKLKEHFSQSHILPSDVQISGIDAEFIKKVNNAIQENLDNSSFGVEELAGKTNLSTSQLYRKLKLLTGQIPNAYLRNYRLQAAAELLSANPGINMKNVMYEVGIESASHFSHVFKKKFGCSPSEYS